MAGYDLNIDMLTFKFIDIFMIMSFEPQMKCL